MNRLAALAALKIACGEMEDKGHEAKAEYLDDDEIPRRTHSTSDQVDEVLGTGALFTPSVDAVNFCEKLAQMPEIQDELLDIRDRSTDGNIRNVVIQRSVDFKTSDSGGEWAGRVTCGYEDLEIPRDHSIYSPEIRSLIELVRGHTTSIVIAESQVGNPDGEYEIFYDESLQDRLGMPLVDEHGDRLPGADGILDVLDGGCIGSLAQPSVPGRQFFPHDHERYAARMRWLHNNVRSPNLLKNAQRWRRDRW